MRRFLFKTGLFFLLVVLLDRGLGTILSYMSGHASGGYLGHQNYIVNRSTDDILVFGSSRAIHHYNAALIADSLGLSCYNCGQDGEGIVLYRAWWEMITQRHRPHLVIYEVTPAYDVLQGDNTKHLGWLKGYYNDEVVRREFEEIDPSERYKMWSLLYRYNSRFHQVLLDYLHPVHNMSLGFLPVHSELDTLRIKEVGQLEESASRVEMRTDSLKLRYFEEMLRDAGVTKFVFVYSPTWYGFRDSGTEPIRDLACRYGCPFLDFTDSAKYVHRNEFFYDGSHLNARGADEFTRDLIHELRKYRIIEESVLSPSIR